MILIDSISRLRELWFAHRIATAGRGILDNMSEAERTALLRTILDTRPPSTPPVDLHGTPVSITVNGGTVNILCHQLPPPPAPAP